MTLQDQDTEYDFLGVLAVVTVLSPLIGTTVFVLQDFTISLIKTIIGMKALADLFKDLLALPKALMFFTAFGFAFGIIPAFCCGIIVATVTALKSRVSIFETLIVSLIAILIVIFELKMIDCNKYFSLSCIIIKTSDLNVFINHCVLTFITAFLTRSICIHTKVMER